MGRLVTRWAPLIAIALPAACAAAAALPATYSAKSIHASVVDETTGRPVARAIVVAQWRLREMGGLEHTLHIATTSTGEDGRFSIPAWGPKPRPPHLILGARAPYLIVFRSGYTPLGLSSQSKASFAKAFPDYKNMSTRDIAVNIDMEGEADLSVHDSVWDGLAIQLEPFNGSSDQWLRLLSSYSGSIRDKDAAAARPFFEALRSERTYFRDHPVRPEHEASLESLFLRVDQLIK